MSNAVAERPQQDSTPTRPSRRRVHVFGTVFFDLVYSGLPASPQPGTEVYASSLGLSPGGIANIAVALARLGLDVGLSAVFADDAFGHYLWSALAHEGIDLTYSTHVGEWTTPVTTSIAYAHEREMITYEERPPIELASLVPDNYHADAIVLGVADAPVAWLGQLHRVAPLVFADVAWDLDALHSSAIHEKLAHVDVFMPNAAEALALTDTSDVEDAATRLAGNGIVAVIKDGSNGAVAVDARTGMCLRVPTVEVAARDTTGAGDVFDAGFIYASLCGLPLDQQVRFANLCAAESVQWVGGALAAPCWRDLAAFWDGLEDPQDRRNYDFLAPLLAINQSRQPCTRACPSMAYAATEGFTADQ